MTGRFLSLVLALLTLAACTSTQAAPPPTQPLLASATSTLSLPSATLPSEAQTPAPGTPAPPLPFVTFTAISQPPVSGLFNPYAVVLVSKDDVLNIRSGPGVGNAVVGTLQATASGVTRTGPSFTAGGDLWVEIQNPGGGTGWVNSNFLTESVVPSTFCSDGRVTALLQSLETAIQTLDGKLLASLVSPTHGLDVRFWRYGTVANYTPEEASWAFQSDYEIKWGPAPGSGAETIGTFSEIPLPMLQEVLGATYQQHCNDPLDLATFSLEPWPAEYANINFYTLFKPGTDQYGGLDWHAWTVGIEFVQGQPTLFALIHYQWEP